MFRAEPGTEYALSLDYQTGQRLGDTAGKTMALYYVGGRGVWRVQRRWPLNPPIGTIESLRSTGERK